MGWYLVARNTCATRTLLGEMLDILGLIVLLLETKPRYPRYPRYTYVTRIQALTFPQIILLAVLATFAEGCTMAGDLPPNSSVVAVSVSAAFTAISFPTCVLPSMKLLFIKSQIHE